MDRQKRNALRKRFRQLWLYVGLPAVVLLVVVLTVFAVRKLDKILDVDAGAQVSDTAEKSSETLSATEGETKETEPEETIENDAETETAENEPESSETASSEAEPAETEGSGPNDKEPLPTSEETETVETESTSEETETAEPETELPPQPDVTAPVMTGVQNLTVEVGSNISYKKNVTVTDDSGECELEIDTTGVDLNTVGTYEVVYKATDAAGNSTSQTIVVTVVKPTEVTEEEIYKLADEVIASCVTEDMTLYEKAEALWDWCHYQIKYSYSSGERGLLAGAYEGLHDRKGDCYAYYATYEVLLTRVGIENMCVTRIGGNSNHWWNLVNLGDGWYHCDTSPRKMGHKYKCFMQTDAQVAAYTEAYTALYPDHPNYFVFESDLYPERATEIILETTIP